MTINLKELLRTSELTSEALADTFIEKLNKIDLFRIGNINISFKDVTLVNLEFLTKFMKYLITIDLQDTDDKIKITLVGIEDSQRDLLTEALKVAKQEVR